MGYADVGADIYVVLGVIAFFAGVASPLAFVIAATTYVCTGLCYAELATAYPVAGGGQYYSMKAFGRLHGFIAGWGLMLAYTADIALFSLATVGYLGVIARGLMSTNLLSLSPYYELIAVALIILLMVLNVVGIRYSSRFNVMIVIADLVTVSIFLVFGLPSIVASGAISIWAGAVVHAFQTGNFGQPGYTSFAYAIALAAASFIGIESISQAAEETRRPSKVIPRATKAAIVSVIVVALCLSLLSVSLVPINSIVDASQAPAVPLAAGIPLIGPVFAVWVAIMGALVCYISTNTGIIGVSRVTFSMGRLGLMPKGFARVSSRFRTPYVTILLFSAIACVLLLASAVLPGPDLLSLIISIYNFGALVAYMYVNAAAVVLRVRDPERKGWKIPLNFTLARKGIKYQVSIIPIIGLISAALVWLVLIGLSTEARIVGSVWFAIGIVGYLIYQKYKRGRKADA